MKKVLSKQMAKTRIESHFALMNLTSSLKNSMELLYLAKFLILLVQTQSKSFITKELMSFWKPQQSDSIDGARTRPTLYSSALGLGRGLEAWLGAHLGVGGTQGL